MNNFIDLLVFIGALYKFAVFAVVATGVLVVIGFVFSMFVSLVEWIF